MSGQISQAGSPATPAEQWLAYFSAGGRKDFAYDLPHLLGVENKRADIALIGSTVFAANAGSALMETHWERQRERAVETRDVTFFGGAQNPVIGVSGEGVHPPTVPVVPWANIVAITVDNLGAARSRASNAGIIPDPGTKARRKDPVEVVLVVNDGAALAATQSTGLVKLRPTPKGQQWGVVPLSLDPGLTAEQVVEFMFDVELLAGTHGIPIYQFGGMSGPVAYIQKVAAIIAQN